MNLGRSETMFLSGSNQGAVTGCTTKGNKNVGRAMYGGGGSSYSFAPDESINYGPKAGLIPHTRTSNCGTVNPLNHGAASQTGGNYAALEEGNVVYGFNTNEKMGNIPPGSFSYPPIIGKSHMACGMTGGKKYRKKGRKGRKRRSKTTRKHNARKGRKYNNKTNKKTRSIRRKTNKKSKSNRRGRRGTRKNMMGGYHQFNSNIPNSPGYAFAPSNSYGAGVLSNPMPYKINHNCNDVYNHYTKTSSEV